MALKAISNSIFCVINLFEWIKNTRNTNNQIIDRNNKMKHRLILLTADELETVASRLIKATKNVYAEAPI